MRMTDTFFVDPFIVVVRDAIRCKKSIDDK